MEPWTMMLAMLGASAGKEMLFDAPNRKAMTGLEATKEKNSWITGKGGTMPQNKFGDSLFQAAVTGAATGQSLATADAQQKLLETQNKILNQYPGMLNGGRKGMYDLPALNQTGV